MRYLVASLCLLAATLTGCQHTPPAYESKYTGPPSTSAAGADGAPVAIIGDSYTGGTPLGGKDEHGWPEVAAADLHGQGVDVTPTVGYQGGSGYAHPGQKGGVFADQVTVIKPTDRLVVVFGSRNDSDIPPDVLTPAVQSTLAAVKAAAPDAKLLVIGPPWLTADPPPGIVAARDIVQAQAAAVGATFVDSLDWLVGHPELISSDGIHPTDEGHAYLAGKIAPLMAQQLQDQPAP